MKHILIPGFFFVAMATMLSVTSLTLQSHIDTLEATWPSSSDSKYAGIFGTGYFDYFMDVLSTLAAKTAALFGIIGDVTVTPTITLYGHTASITTNALIGMINAGFLFWLGAGLYSAIRSGN